MRSKKNNKAKVEKTNLLKDPARYEKKQFLAVVTIALLVCFFGMNILLYRWLVVGSNAHNHDITRSFEASRTMKGFACGVLDEKTAKKLIGDEVEKRSYVSPSVFFNQPITFTDNTKGSSGVIEGCAYTAQKNSSKYVSFSLTGFMDENSAKTYFEQVTLRAPEVEQLGEQFGGKLAYSNDGYTFLKGNSIYVIAASNGIVSENKTVSHQLLEVIFTKL